MIEKDMEDLIAAFPGDFFPRTQLEVVGRQQSFAGVGRFDILFEDEFKSTILMELKARTLKYEDATQVARYRDELIRRGRRHVVMWLVAPHVPASVREFLDDKGIEYSEIHFAEFRRVADRHNFRIQSEGEVTDLSRFGGESSADDPRLDSEEPGGSTNGSHSRKLSRAADILFGQVRGSILDLLSSHIDRAFYLRQVAREVDISPGAVQRELDTLVEIGLAVRTSVGNQVFYQANQKNSLFCGIQSLVAKTIGLFRVLQAALMESSQQIRIAFVYGSVARYEDKPDSDIDVLVVGEVESEAVLARLSLLERSLGRSIDPRLYTPAEFVSRFKSGNHFLNAIMGREKIFLIGTEDDLQRLINALSS